MVSKKHFHVCSEMLTAHSVLPLLCTISVAATLRTPCPITMSQYSGGCYVLVKNAVPWVEANKRCKEKGNNFGLVSILDGAENDFVVSLVRKYLGENSTGAWLGLTDKFTINENHFDKWSDGQPLSWNSFDIRHRPSIFGNMDCVVIRRSKLWQPTHCGYRRPFICKWSRTKLSAHVLLPPADYKYCDEGYVQFMERCYSLIVKPQVFSEADRMCKLSIKDKMIRKFAGLARVDSFVENEFLISLLASVQDKVAWFGLHYQENHFHWTDNNAVSYLRWPVNMTHVGENSICVAIGGSKLSVLTGHWYARECSDKLPYICQAPLMRMTPLPKRDNCPPGYSHYRMGDTCYRLSNKIDAYDDAMATCATDDREFGSSSYEVGMLTLTSSSELSFVFAWLMANGVTPNQTVWLGLKLTQGKPLWKWNSGLLVNFTYTSGLPVDPSGCTYLLMAPSGSRYGMQMDPSCRLPSVTVCKFGVRAPRPLTERQECLQTPEGHGYVGHQTRTKSGRNCVRWDLLNPFVRMRFHLTMPGSSISSAVNFCRRPRGVTAKAPFCYIGVGNDTHEPRLEECDIPLCAQQGIPVYFYAILVTVVLVSFILIGVIFWCKFKSTWCFSSKKHRRNAQSGKLLKTPSAPPPPPAGDVSVALTSV